MLREMRQCDGNQRKQQREVLPGYFVDHDVLRILLAGIFHHASAGPHAHRAQNDQQQQRAKYWQRESTVINIAAPDEEMFIRKHRFGKWMLREPLAYRSRVQEKNRR